MLRFAFAAVSLLGLVSSAFAVGPVTVDLTAKKPPKLISEFNLFKDNAKQIPNDGVVPYDLNSPLFSDYASKYRFVWMPEGTSAKYDEQEAFSFPVGTIIVKTFSFPHDMRDPSKGEHIVETRLLIHKPEGWIGLPYVWKPDMSDAELKIAGKQVDVKWIHTDGSERSNRYIVPNTNQCMSCHENAKTLQPIGPKARHLNKSYQYAEGEENQLTHWAKIGYLTGVPAPESAPKAAVWDHPETGTLDARARAWLDINCAHCHNPKGAASPSGLDLTILQNDPFKLGVMKPPVAAGRAAVDRLYSIVPGKPDASILVYRLETTDPGIMMPQLPRKLVDEEGVALIREWIAGMK